MRAVSYLRASTEEQVEEGHSMDAQRTSTRQFIEGHGWSLVHEYVDAGLSAKRDSQRPALERLLREAARGRFDVVVVDKVDRFYRHLQGLLSALDELNDHGVTFVSVKENLDFSTPWGKPVNRASARPVVTSSHASPGAAASETENAMSGSAGRNSTRIASSSRSKASSMETLRSVRDRSPQIFSAASRVS